MPAPSVRYKILPARGDISALNAAVAAIDEGELCYALDEDKLYVKKNGSLLAVSSEAPVNSVAGKTGDVTLVKADITDFSDADYATAAQGALADTALQSGDNISELVNDAGYITEIPGSLFTGRYRYESNTTLTPPAAVVRFNSTTYASVTQIAFSKIDREGRDTSEFLNDIVQPGFTVYFEQQNDPTRSVMFEITSFDSNNAGNVIWNVALVSETGVALQNNNDAVTQFESPPVVGLQPGDNVSELTNDAGYITDAGVTQIIAGTNVTIDPVGGTGAVTINATGAGGGIPEAPIDGNQYARQNAGWSVVQAGEGGTTIEYSGAAAWGSIAQSGQLSSGLNCTTAVSSDGFGFDVTFNTPMPDANYSITACAAWRANTVSDVQYTNVTANGFRLYVLNQSGTAQLAEVRFAVHALNALPPQGGTGADSWVEFDGTSAIGTDCTIRASFNVSRVEHTGTGTYTIHFTNPMPTSNYATFNSANVNVNTNNVGVVSPAGVVNTTTSYKIQCASGETSTAFDCAFVSSMVHCTNAQLPDTVTQEQIEAAINNPGASAWVLGNGDGTTQSSLNIASVTRTGLGLYDVAFATPMPSADYSVQCTVAEDTFSVVAYNTARTANGFSIKIANSNDQRFDLDFSAVVHATNALPPKGGTGADSWADTAVDGTLQAGFNIASVTKGGTGIYDYVFTNPMPTANYAVVTSINDNTFATSKTLNRTTTGFRIYITFPNASFTNTPIDYAHSVVVHATNAQLPDTVTQEQIEAAINNPGLSAWGLVAQTTVNGPCQVNGSLNVASVTRTSLGLYDVVFQNPMPSANYAVVGSSFGANTFTFSPYNQSATGFSVQLSVDTGLNDQAFSFHVAATNALPPRGGTGADAWMSCKAGGTVESSFNIASVTKSATGKYDLVFTTPMPTADYAIVTAAGNGSSASIFVLSKTTTGCQIGLYSDITQTYVDTDFNVVVHATNAQLPDTVTQEQIDNVLSGTFTGSINLGAVSVYTDNTAAKAGGLVDGDVYRKADGTLMIVFT